MKIYSYKNCGTCQKALKFIKANNLEAEVLPIRETPPSKAEIKRMIAAYNGNIKPLFNTSGKDYREQNIKEKLPQMTEAELISLLSQNGNLIKRPFVLTETQAWVGFKEDEWQQNLAK